MAALVRLRTTLKRLFHVGRLGGSSYMRKSLAALGLCAVLAGSAYAGPIYDSSEPLLRSHSGTAFISRHGFPVVSFLVDDTGTTSLPSFDLTHGQSDELLSTVLTAVTLDHGQSNQFFSTVLPTVALDARPYNGVMFVGTVPEPSVFALLGLGLIGVGLAVRRRQ